MLIYCWKKKKIIKSDALCRVSCERVQIDKCTSVININNITLKTEDFWLFKPIKDWLVYL